MSANTSIPLRAVLQVLQDLGDAVSHDDVEAYREALQRAREVGCSDQQINDAWQWRATLRLRRSSLPPVSFNAKGEQS